MAADALYRLVAAVVRLYGWWVGRHVRSELKRSVAAVRVNRKLPVDTLNRVCVRSLLQATHSPGTIRIRAFLWRKQHHD